ncbi:MAG TPA: hypothetical protein VFF14_01360 [Candidatus Deferrimicrobium sp.]|nr:hypothetical protein [Candidatus Deferrimicrobium sp.]
MIKSFWLPKGIEIDMGDSPIRIGPWVGCPLAQFGRWFIMTGVSNSSKKRKRK